MKPQIKESNPGVQYQDIQPSIAEESELLNLQSPGATTRDIKSRAGEEDDNDNNLAKAFTLPDGKNPYSAQGNNVSVNFPEPGKSDKQVENEKNDEKNLDMQDTTRKLNPRSDSSTQDKQISKYKERLRSHFLTLERNKINKMSTNNNRDLLDHSERMKVEVNTPAMQQLYDVMVKLDREKRFKKASRHLLDAMNLRPVRHDLDSTVIRFLYK